MKPVNRLGFVPDLGKLNPGTKLDQLLSKEDQKLFEPRALRKSVQTIVEAIKQLGKICDGMTQRDRLYPIYYPMFYRMACAQLRTGLTRDALEAGLGQLADSDEGLAAVVREAIEDAMAGRPAKYQK